MTSLDRRCAGRLAAWLTLFLWLTSLGIAAPVRFDIPAQSAQSALRAFNVQSGRPAVFVYDDLEGVRANAVVGEFEPIEALTRLLEGTGFEVTLTSYFVVGRAAKSPAPAGRVRGNLTKTDGGDPAGIRVVVSETGQSVFTDARGNFAFVALGPGTYRLVALAEGYQPLHLVGVKVRPAEEIQLGAEAMRLAKEVTELQPFVVRAQLVTPRARDPASWKSRPFPGRNVDRPRSRDDAQPYYIFDQANLEHSGATNLEEFLKQRLTMNGATRTSRQTVTPDYVRPGGNSTVDLRGLGLGSTLVLINGRRSASPAVQDSLAGAGYAKPVYGQTDLNGIPFAAVDRIEVLPSSASGIYGGGAMGGVVNVVLKSDFSGAEVQAGWGSTTDGHAPRRVASAVVGTELEGGRTHLMLTAHAADERPLRLRDRPEILDRGYRRLARDHPEFFKFGIHPPTPFVPLGSTVNLASADGSDLRLKGTGASLGSSIGTLPADYAFTTTATLGAAVIPGRWTTTDPDVNEGPNGLDSPLGSEVRNTTFRATLNRAMTARVQAYAEFSYAATHSRLSSNPATLSGASAATISASAPTNPFAQDIVVAIPFQFDPPTTSDAVARSVTVGAAVKLGAEWDAALDYTWSGNSINRQLYGLSNGLGYYYDFSSAVTAGLVNPFDGSAAGRAKLSADARRYYLNYDAIGESSLNDLALRTAGPVLSLASGDITLAGALEHRREGIPRLGSTEMSAPVATPTLLAIAANLRPSVEAGSVRGMVFFGQVQTTDSAHLETNVPLVTARNARPFLQQFDLQAAVRFDRTTVGVGSPSYTFYPLDLTIPVTAALPPFGLTNPVFRAKTSYSATNGMLGVRYKPTAEFTLRAAYATAFLPPTSYQLSAVTNSAGTVLIHDPVNGQNYFTNLLATGNPRLKPQRSEAWDLGLTWTPPTGAPLQGLRFNVQYSRITQYDAIAPTPAAWVLADPGRYGGTFFREPAVDRINYVVAPNMNLLQRESGYFDLAVDYRRPTAAGTFGFMALGTYNESVKQQYAVGVPALELAGYPSEGGPVKLKGNATASWETPHWSVGWTTEYFGSYHQNIGLRDQDIFYATWVDAQGSDQVGGDVYHHAFVSYAFDDRAGRRGGTPRVPGPLSGVTVTLVVRNLFDHLPALDVYNAPFYSSYSGDLRLREFILTVKKTF